MALSNFNYDEKTDQMYQLLTLIEEVFCPDDTVKVFYETTPELNF
jgi:hypothetical protein